MPLTSFIQTLIHHPSLFAMKFTVVVSFLFGSTALATPTSFFTPSHRLKGLAMSSEDVNAVTDADVEHGLRAVHSWTNSFRVERT